MEHAYLEPSGRHTSRVDVQTIYYPNKCTERTGLDNKKRRNASRFVPLKATQRRYFNAFLAMESNNIIAY
jgi:hypothetical protein